MIKFAAFKIVNWLLNAGAISQKDKDLYEYAAYSLLFNLLPFCIVTVLGCIIGIPSEGILMILPLVLIRNFSGGFHLKSPALCLVFSTTLLFTSLISIKTLVAERHVFSFTVLVASAAVQIFLCSPIESEARKLSKKEFIIFKKAAKTMSILFLMSYIILSVLGLIHFSVPIGYGIILTAMLQIPCFFSKKKDIAN